MTASQRGGGRWERYGRAHDSKAYDGSNIVNASSALGERVLFRRFQYMQAFYMFSFLRACVCCKSAARGPRGLHPERRLRQCVLGSRLFALETEHAYVLALVGPWPVCLCLLSTRLGQWAFRTTRRKSWGISYTSTFPKPATPWRSGRRSRRSSRSRRQLTVCMHAINACHQTWQACQELANRSGTLTHAAYPF